MAAKPIRLTVMQLPPLPENKSLRITLGVTAAIFLLVVIILLSAGSESPVEVTPQTVAPVAEAPLPAPPNVENSQAILELFSPTEESLNGQLQQSTISRQIEQALTVSYVLTKCLIISQDDYRDTFRALVVYAERSNLAIDPVAADTIVREIAQSANASYALIYSRTSCTDKQLPGLAKELVRWTNAVLMQR